MVNSRGIVAGHSQQFVGIVPVRTIRTIRQTFRSAMDIDGHFQITDEEPAPTDQVMEQDPKFNRPATPMDQLIDYLLENSEES